MNKKIAGSILSFAVIFVGVFGYVSFKTDSASAGACYTVTHPGYWEYPEYGSRYWVAPETEVICN